MPGPRQIRLYDLRLGIPCVGILAVNLGCSSLDIPEGPDLSEIAAIYDAPDGIVFEENLAEVMGVFEAELEQLSYLGDLEFIIETLEGVGEVITETAKKEDDALVKITGVTKVRGACPGLNRVAAPHVDNGNLEFTVTFKDSYLEEAIWGRFNNCETYQANTGVTLDSTMDIYLGGPMYLGNLRFDALLFRLDGEYRHEGESFLLDFDFRYQGDSVELRIPADEGDVIFLVGDSLDRVAVRTRDGSLCCEFAERACYDLDGDICDDSHSGEKISW